MDATDKLKQAFREVFDLPPQADFEALRYRAIPQWDSVAHMQLVGALESTFDIMLEAQDILDLSSFSKAKEILRKYECPL